MGSRQRGRWRQSKRSLDKWLSLVRCFGRIPPSHPRSAMSLDQETITQQQEQLAVHRRRLGHLFQQCATLGAYTPPYVALDIEQTQTNIRSLKALLRENGVPVEDHRDDERPVQVSAPPSPALHQLRAPVGD